MPSFHHSRPPSYDLVIPCKRRPIRLPVFFIAVLLGDATPGVTQTGPDLSGVDQFWTIADQLAADSEPDSVAWRKLLDTPAYKQLAQDQRVQRMLRLAFRPSFGREADSMVATGTYNARVIQHLRLVREQRVLLQGFRDSLAKVDMVAEAGRLAAPFLPAGELERRPPPRLAYAFFGPEAYGGQDGIIMDLLFARDRGSHLLAIIGHEVHHYHVGHLTGLRFPERSSPAFTLLQSLRNLANEGTADRVDLRFPTGPPKMPEDVTPAYNAGYRDAAATLREIDSLMSRVGSDTARMRQAGKDVSSRLAFGGHPVGAYMAERLDDRLGRAALIATVGNPFAFFRQFNEAEGRAGVRPFSEATLKLVAELEASYFTPIGR
jgi:hypothetical protein